MPKISVVMPAYNAEKYIAEAIDSILGQTFRDFEFIILNDCSTDGTEKIILSYDDPRIVYLKNEKNMGVAATLNRGLAAATGEYIARMDADDISLPERFAKQVDYLDSHRQVAVLGCGVECFGRELPTQIRKFSTDGRQMQVDMLFTCGIVHPSVMFRLQAVLEAGGYDPEFEGMEDYELWWRVMQNWQVVTLPEALLRYRLHPNQVTQQVSPQKKARERRLKEKQLAQLGMAAEGPIAETFYDYRARCEKDYDQALREIRFYEAVLEANQKSNIYDMRLLRKTFIQLAKGNAVGLPAEACRALCAQTKLLRRWEVALSCLKRKLLK